MASLTCLLNLSAADDDYGGGGTAFWGESGEPLVIRPTVGTALIFGGKVTHSGVAVASGQRVVLVASFSPADPSEIPNSTCGYGSLE